MTRQHRLVWIQLWAGAVAVNLIAILVAVVAQRWAALALNIPSMLVAEWCRRDNLKAYLSVPPGENRSEG